MKTDPQGVRSKVVFHCERLQRSPVGGNFALPFKDLDGAAITNCDRAKSKLSLTRIPGFECLGLVCRQDKLRVCGTDIVNAPSITAPQHTFWLAPTQWQRAIGTRGDGKRGIV